MTQPIIVAGLAVALSACAAMPLGTMMQLSSWDIERSDPAEIRAAVRLPDGIGIAAGSPSMALSAWRGDNQDRIDDRIVLVEVNDQAEHAGLGRWQKPGFTIHAYRIPDGDVPRIAAFRRRASEAGLNHFSLQIEAKGCRGGAYDGPLLIATFLKTGGNLDYVMLTREIDLARLPQAAAKGGAALPPCG